MISVLASPAPKLGVPLSGTLSMLVADRIAPTATVGQPSVKGVDAEAISA